MGGSSAGRLDPLAYWMEAQPLPLAKWVTTIGTGPALHTSLRRPFSLHTLAD